MTARDDEPVFTRLVAPRTEITNVFTPETHPSATALIEVEDPHAHFLKTVAALARLAKIPSLVIDQFYVFTGLVQGRVASARSFWLSEYPGMKALVAHAIEASVKSPQTVFSVYELKQAGDIQNFIADEVRTISKSQAIKPGNNYSPAAYMALLLPKLNTRWPGVVFSENAKREARRVPYEGDANKYITAMTRAIADRLLVEKPGMSATRASHLAVVSYVRGLFRKRQFAEADSRRVVVATGDAPTGEKLFSVVMTFVDKTYYSSLQLALQYAKIPLDFTNERFIGAIHDARMADYVAALYNQAFARSRHTITARRTTMIDAHVSVVLQELIKYKPPNVELPREELPRLRGPPEPSAPSFAVDDTGDYFEEERPPTRRQIEVYESDEDEFPSVDMGGEDVKPLLVPGSLVGVEENPWASSI